MTAQDVKDFVTATLKPLRDIAQEVSVFNKLIDWISEQLNLSNNDSDLIPSYKNTLTFNTDGSGDGAFCTSPDVNGTLRFWHTKVDGNISNLPPTDPDEHENLFWEEVSPSYGTAFKEWKAGFYPSGVQIVFVTNALYVLNVGPRPFNSTNFPTELAANKWVKLGGSGGGTGRITFFRFNSDLFTEQAFSFRGLISELSIMKTAQINSVSYGIRLDAGAWAAASDLAALQTWINANVTGTEATGTIYWVKVYATYNAGSNGEAEVRLIYTAS